MKNKSVQNCKLSVKMYHLSKNIVALSFALIILIPIKLKTNYN